MSEIGWNKSELDTPVLWVDLDLMENNIAWLGEHFKAAGVKWRPHTKGIKVPAISHKAIAAGAIGVTCAKLSEAEVMAAAGIKDILIANQIVGTNKTVRLANLRRHTNVKVAADHEDNLRQLNEAALAKGVRLGVLIEIDVGLGRSGVEPGDAAVQLSHVVHHDMPGLTYLGLMAWEGHASVIENPDRKRREIEVAINLLTETAEKCHSAGLPVSIVSAGGSATSEVTPFLPGITEIQAGGAIFSDLLYQARGVTNKPSLFVRSMVTSHPTPNRLIFDAGFKALPDWRATPKPIGFSGVKSVRMSAEHATVILEKPSSNVKVGDTFDFVVGYGDYTVFLHDRLYGIRNDVVEVVWSVQGRGKLR